MTQQILELKERNRKLQDQLQQREAKLEEVRNIVTWAGKSLDDAQRVARVWYCRATGSKDVGYDVAERVANATVWEFPPNFEDVSIDDLGRMLALADNLQGYLCDAWKITKPFGQFVDALWDEVNKREEAMAKEGEQ